MSVPVGDEKVVTGSIPSHPFLIFVLLSILHGELIYIMSKLKIENWKSAGHFGTRRFSPK